MPAPLRKTDSVKKELWILVGIIISMEGSRIQLTRHPLHTGADDVQFFPKKKSKPKSY